MEYPEVLCIRVPKGTEKRIRAACKKLKARRPIVLRCLIETGLALSELSKMELLTDNDLLRNTVEIGLGLIGVRGIRRTARADKVVTMLRPDSIFRPKDKGKWERV